MFADSPVTEAQYHGLLVITKVSQTLSAVEISLFAQNDHTATYQSTISSIVALESVITATAHHHAREIEYVKLLTTVKVNVLMSGISSTSHQLGFQLPLSFSIRTQRATLGLPVLARLRARVVPATPLPKTGKETRVFAATSPIF